jgi:hypothetical protein
MRYVVSFGAGCVLAALTALLFMDQATAYLPGNCNARHAVADYDMSDAVVIGRVVAVERVLEKLRYANGRDDYHFSYVATVRVGRAVRGTLSVGDEFRMLVGGYFQSSYDDTAPVGRLMTCNTHSPHDLPPAGVRLLFVNRARDLQRDRENPKGPEVSRDELARRLVEEGNVWEPRSCHFSVHEIVWGTDGKDGKTLWVEPSSRPWGDAKPEAQLLDDFLSQKREEAQAIREKTRVRKQDEH